MIETTLEALTAYLRMTPDEHVQLTDTASAESLAQLYAEANLMQDALGRSVFPFIDQTARTRFLDRGSDAFAVAYRALNVTLPHIEPLALDYTIDGYRAGVDAERKVLDEEREAMERQHQRIHAQYDRLLTTLHAEFGDRVKDVYAAYVERERAALSDGILTVPEA
jgi:hypothetical protein